MTFASIPELLDELRAGRMIVLVDDPDRENEGDVIFPAELAHPELINFLLKECRGELCLALDGAICDQLGLEMQARAASNRATTAFTMTIEAANGVTTGISAADRAHTIRVAAQRDAGPEDLITPGHVHPLRARDGGVLVRPGHTEGSVDLCRLAGFRPAAVLMEILKEDGSVARLPDLMEFSSKHGLKIGCIADLIAWRRKNERLVTRVASVPLPTRHGEFTLHLYRSDYDAQEHIALTRGLDVPAGDEPAPPVEEPVLGRVHSECVTGDAFGSLRCDCGDQLDLALQVVAGEDKGFLLYMRQEGRGIGLANKLRAYALQDQGLDTVEANSALGFKPDQRNYGTGASILFDLGIRKMRLLTNNPSKRSALAGYGLEIVDRVPLRIEPNSHNAKYLQAKKLKMGHML